MSEDEQRREELQRQWDWWMLSAPLEVAVMRRMGLAYPTAEELAANGYQWERPLPDMQYVREELARLEALQLDPEAIKRAEQELRKLLLGESEARG